jgi:hypothetical protein
VKVRMSSGSTAFQLVPLFCCNRSPVHIKSNTGMGFRLGCGWPGPKAADTLFELEKSQSRAGGTAGAQPCPQNHKPDQLGTRTALVPPCPPLGQAGKRLGP